MKTAWIDPVDRTVGKLISLAQWLVLPVTFLLFIQWPLRELVQAFSREANDLAQWLFALYVSVAITAATRARLHLAVDLVARRYSPAARNRIGRFGALLCVAPWSFFVLIAGAPVMWRSVAGLEAFPDTFNPGYFFIKIAAWLLALLLLVQAVLDVLPRQRQG
jgi:TRAP-type mannitol/chloroaromatic compound transport system permease small subunit